MTCMTTDYFFSLDPPVIHMCTVEKSQCEVTVAYDPRIAHPDSEEYKIESIEIGFHDSDSWHSIHHKDGYDFSPNVLVVLPPSREPVQRQLQVAVKYVKINVKHLSSAHPIQWINNQSVCPVAMKCIVVCRLVEIVQAASCKV